MTTSVCIYLTGSPKGVFVCVHTVQPQVRSVTMRDEHISSGWPESAPIEFIEPNPKQNTTSRRRALCGVRREVGHLFITFAVCDDACVVASSILSIGVCSLFFLPPTRTNPKTKNHTIKRNATHQPRLLLDYRAAAWATD